MFFSEIIEQVGKGHYVLNKENQKIFEVTEASKIKIQFFPENVKICCIDGKEFDINFTEFKNFSYKKRMSIGNSESQVALLFNKKECFVCNETKMQSIKELLESYANLFDDDEICSPKYQIETLIDDLSLDCEKKFNYKIWNLLLIYKNKLLQAFDEGFFEENSKILLVIEEDSGNIVGNLGETAKKGLSNMLKNFNGVSSIVQMGVGIAKAAGTRVAKGLVNEFISEKSIMVLTNNNVIAIKKESLAAYTFDEAEEIFKARLDETLAGVVDIYDDCENIILNNVGQTEWNLFKKELRSLRKNSEQTLLKITELEEDEITKKLSKLKMMLDKGIITQEDFDAKKQEILSMI